MNASTKRRPRETKCKETVSIECMGNARSADDSRWRWEIGAVLVAALLGSFAGVAGAFVAADSSSDSLAAQLAQDRVSALRSERAAVFRRYLTSAQQQSPGFGDVSAGPDISEGAVVREYRVRLRYERLREQAELYASDVQLKALDKLDGAISDLRQVSVGNDVPEASYFKEVADARQHFLDLLRDDLQFASVL